MPKIRDHKRPGQIALLVSPWQSKHDKPTATRPASQDINDSTRLYSVLTSDTLLAGPDPQQQHQTVTAPATQQEPTAKPAAAAVAHTPLASLSSSTGWHTRPTHPTTAPRHPPPPPAAAASSAAAAAAPALQLTLLQEHSNCKPTHTPLEQQQQQQQHAVGAPAGGPCSSCISDTSADPTEATADSQQQEASQSQHTASSGEWLADTAAAARAPGSSCTPGVLQGVAQLVLHPTGAVSGHFIALNTDRLPNDDPNRSSSVSSRKRKAASEQRGCGNSSAGGSAGGGSSSSSSRSRLCLGLQGRQVLGIHSCYRDPEWALLQLTIIRYSNGDVAKQFKAAAVEAAVQVGLPHCPRTPAAAAAAAEEDEDGSDAAAGVETGLASSQAECVAWVQRKGGDLVTLEPADMDDEDTEAAVMAENLGEVPDSPTVNFTAHTLLSGAAAAGVLWATRPELVGQPDLVVNLGDMTISGLPSGFLRRHG